MAPLGAGQRCAGIVCIFMVPSLQGGQSGCLCPFWTEEDPANKKSIVSFACLTTSRRKALFIQQVLLHFIFQMHLTTGGARFTFTFVTSSSQLFFSFFFLTSELSEKQQNQTRVHVIYPGLHGIQNHLPRLGKFMEGSEERKMALVHTNKTVGTKSGFMRVKYFPFPKVNFGLKYRKLVFVLRVKCFRTHQTSAQKRNFCSSWFDEIGAAKALLPSSTSTERMYLFTL